MILDVLFGAASAAGGGVAAWIWTREASGSRTTSGLTAGALAIALGTLALLGNSDEAIATALLAGALALDRPGARVLPPAALAAASAIASAAIGVAALASLWWRPGRPAREKAVAAAAGLALLAAPPIADALGRLFLLVILAILGILFAPVAQRLVLSRSARSTLVGLGAAAPALAILTLLSVRERLGRVTSDLWLAWGAGLGALGAGALAAVAATGLAAVLSTRHPARPQVLATIIAGIAAAGLAGPEGILALLPAAGSGLGVGAALLVRPVLPAPHEPRP